MAITKAQKEILLVLQEKPQYRIYNPEHRAASLINENNDRIRTINYPLFSALRPWLKQDESVKYSPFSRTYMIDPEAVISDDWPEKKREIERVKREAEKATRQAKAKAESDKAAVWFECDGPYTVDFSGDYFSGSGSINVEGKFVASIGPIWSSSEDRTFDTVMERPENVGHFSRIKEMLRRANREE